MITPSFRRKARLALGALCSMAAVIPLQAQPDAWDQKANFAHGPSAEPTARYGAVAFSIGTKGYLGTGHDGKYKADFWEYDPQSDSWAQKANFAGGARQYAVGFSIGPKGYLGTGYTGSNHRKDFWEYDPGTNAWTQKADFGGTARSRAMGFEMGGLAYMGTGYNGGYLKDFWTYDPGTDSWTQLADFGGTARSFAAAFSLGGTGFVGTGFDGASKKDFWAYDPGTDTWTQKADFGGVARNGAVAFTVGAMGYVSTGFGSNFMGDLWAYDASSDTWTQKSGAGVAARSGAVAFAIDGIGYMGTGWNGDVMSDLLAYDASLDTWTVLGDFNGVARGYSVGFSIDAKGYVGVGWNGAFRKDFWEYDPEQDTWAQKADFAGTARTGAVGFSIGTKGYVGTGWSGVYEKDLWEYDPAMNTWTQKADLGGAARYAAVGFGIGTKGYLGTGYSGTYRKDFWEYDPGTDTWTQKADLGGAARYNAVGFSIHDKGYVGTGNSGTDRKDFWAYDPGTNTWTQKADFGGTARSGATGFATGTKGYLGTGNDGAYKKDFWEYDPSMDTWTQRSDFGGTARSFAFGFGIGDLGYLGAGRDGSMRNDFWAYSPAGPCNGDQVVVVIHTDDAPGEITWEITDDASNVIASGAPGASQSGMTVSETVCLNGAATSACYGFRLYDGHGDGITGGGWELRTTDGRIILQDDFSNGGVSPATPAASGAYGDAHSFCLPLGPADIAPSECGIFNNAMGNKVYANKVTGASNYQFEFSDPDAGFIRRISKPRNYVLFNEMVTNPLVPGVKYFARVRTDHAGPMAQAYWGSGCEMGIGTQVLGCPELIPCPYYGHSCGQERAFNSNNSFIYATPITGATEYQFRLFNLGELYDETFTRPTYILQLKWNSNVAEPLKNGYTYSVEVSAKVNGVWTGFCPSPCNIIINNAVDGTPPCPVEESLGRLYSATLWPNPAADGTVNLVLDDLAAGTQQIGVEVTDIYGRRVHGATFGNNGDRFSTVLELPQGLANGLYLVNVTVNGESVTERLSIMR